MAVLPLREDRVADLAVRIERRVRTVDLSRVGWVTPMHLVGVAAIAHEADRCGDRFRLIGPVGRAASYAARMRLGRVVEELGGQHDLPASPREFDQRDSLVELQILQSADDVRRLSKLLRTRIQDRDEEMAHKLHNSVAELGANVCDHAEAVGFMAAQTTAAEARVTFAVADAGVGLLGTLGRHGASDHPSAIDMALSGVSESGAPGRGKGLPATVRDVGSLDGALVAVSGDGVYRVDARGRVGGRCGSNFDGTLLEGWVRTERAPKLGAATW